MDVAASEFYGEDKRYNLNFKEEVSLCHSLGPQVNAMFEGYHISAYESEQDLQQLGLHYLFTYFYCLSVQKNDGSQKIPGDALKDLYKSFVSEYPIVSIEDPFDQDDWEHYGKMTSEVGEKVQIVGDDLLVTNPKVSHQHALLIQ